MYKKIWAQVHRQRSEVKQIAKENLGTDLLKHSSVIIVLIFVNMF